MSPTRRSVLRTGALVAAGLVAGCTAAPIASDGSGDPDDPAPTPGDGPGDGPGSDDDSDGPGGTRPAGTGGPGLALGSVDEAPDLPVQPAVEVTRDVATDDHPPQLRVTLTNVSDGPVRVGEARAVVFQYVTDDDGHLLLLPAEGEWPAEPGCWRLTDGIAVTEEYRIETLDPGASLSALVDLYGAPGHDACLPVGNFRFETTVSTLAGTEGVPDGSDGASARWGFSVSLE